MRWRWALVVVVGLLAALGLFVARRNAVPLEALWAIAAGWFGFLRRVAPKVRPTRSGLVTAAICLGAVAFGLHRSLGWLSRSTGRTAWRARWTASVLGVVLLMFVAGIAAAGIAHQVTWLATEPEPWTEFRPFGPMETNNLKEVVLGAIMDDSDHPGALRPAAKFDAAGKPLHGWMTLVLPYMGLRTDHLDLNTAWDDPRNAPSFKTFVPDYLNPVVMTVRDRDGYGLSHYAGNVHVLGRKPRPVASLPDGASNTLLIGEVAAHFRAWGRPLTERDPTAGLGTTPDGFACPTGGAVLFAFADGSVRRVGPRVDPKVLRAMAGAR